MTSSEYLKLFPGAELVSAETRKKVSDSVQAAFLERFGCNPSQLPEKKEKRRQTMQQRYGVNNAMQNAELNKRCCTKRDATLNARYGVSNPLYIDGVSEKIQKAFKKTCLEKYGVDHYMKLSANSSQQKEKREKTMQTKHGVKNAMQVPAFAEKCLQSNLNLPTSIEKRIIALQIPFLSYTGKGTKWVTLNYQNMRVNKNPDFCSDVAAKVLECFGDYWHRDEDPTELERAYKEIGYQALVLWEHEINALDDPTLKLHIEKFLELSDLRDYTLDTQ
jgi:hypothetical protein